MRILFITLSNIGDVILSTVLLDRVLASHPEATVDVVVGKGAASLFEGLENIGQVYPVIKKKRHGHYIGLWKQLRSEKYDIVIDLRTPLLGRLLKGKKKIVYKPNMKEHKAEQMAKLWPLPEERPLRQKISVSAEVMEKVHKEAGSDKLIVAIAPTANWIGKRWPQKNFAQAAQALCALPHFKDAHFAVFGAEHERPTVSDFVSYVPQDRLIDLIGKTTLPEAYAWLKKCDLFIGNDSGLAHMAAAANIPTVTIFGPTWPEIYAPVSTIGTTVLAPDRAQANLESVLHKRLITDVCVEDVVESVEKLFLATQKVA